MLVYLLVQVAVFSEISNSAGEGAVPQKGKKGLFLTGAPQLRSKRRTSWDGNWPAWGVGWLVCNSGRDATIHLPFSKVSLSSLGV